MNTPLASSLRAFVALALFLVLSVGCSSASPNVTLDPTQMVLIEAELESFLLQKICADEAEWMRRVLDVAARVDSIEQGGRYALAGATIQAWLCQDGKPVQVAAEQFTESYADAHRSWSENYVGFFNIVSVASTKASLVLCNKWWREINCWELLLAKRDGRWKVNSQKLTMSYHVDVFEPPDTPSPPTIDGRPATSP